MAHEGMDKVAVNLPGDMIAKLDEYAERMKKRSPRVQFTRSDAIRELIDRGLAEAGRTR